MKRILKKLPLILTFIGSVICGSLCLTPVIPEDYKLGIGVICLVFGLVSLSVMLIKFIIDTANDI